MPNASYAAEHSPRHDSAVDIALSAGAGLVVWRDESKMQCVRLSPRMISWRHRQGEVIFAWSDIRQIS